MIHQRKGPQRANAPALNFNKHDGQPMPSQDNNRNPAHSDPRRILPTDRLDFLDDISKDRRLRKHAHRVASNMMSYRNGDTGDIFPRYSTIADALGISKSEVRKCVSNLEACGYFEKVASFHRDGGGQRSNDYFPVFDRSKRAEATERAQHKAAGRAQEARDRKASALARRLLKSCQPDGQGVPCAGQGLSSSTIRLVA